MSKNVAKISLPPKTLLGYRRSGTPIFNIAGGADEPVPEGDTITIPAPVAEPSAKPEKTYTESELRAIQEKARQEEKDKLYSKISKFEENAKTLQEEIAAARKQREDAEAAAAKALADAEAVAAKKAEDELSVRDLLAKKEEEWDNKFKTVQQEREQERLLAEKESQFRSLQAYAQNAVNAALANNEIAPELANFISGNTEEEIQASLNSVKIASEAILTSVQQAATAARANMRGVSPTGYAPVGPMDNDPSHLTLTAEDLRNMSMSDYAKIRGSIGIGNAGANKGMYS